MADRRMFSREIFRSSVAATREMKTKTKNKPDGGMSD